MENASKALIIAGAILVSILIISLGIMIYRQASGVVNNNAMDEVDVSSFNAKFEQYCGSNIRGANVKALYSAVDSNNNTYQDDESRQVTIKGETKDKIQTGKTYKVEVTNTTSAGLVHEITVTAN